MQDGEVEGCENRRNQRNGRVHKEKEFIFSRSIKNSICRWCFLMARKYMCVECRVSERICRSAHISINKLNEESNHISRWNSELKFRSNLCKLACLSLLFSFSCDENVRNFFYEPRRRPGWVSMKLGKFPKILSFIYPRFLLLFLCHSTEFYLFSWTFLNLIDAGVNKMFCYSWIVDTGNWKSEILSNQMFWIFFLTRSSTSRWADTEEERGQSKFDFVGGKTKTTTNSVRMSMDVEPKITLISPRYSRVVTHMSARRSSQQNKLLILILASSTPPPSLP